MSDYLDDISININDDTDTDHFDGSLEINHDRPPLANNIEEKMKKARKILRGAGLGTMGLSGMAIIEYFAGKHPHDPHHKFPSFSYPMAIFGTFTFGLWLVFFSFVLPKHPRSVCGAKILMGIAVVLLFKESRELQGFGLVISQGRW